MFHFVSKDDVPFLCSDFSLAHINYKIVKVGVTCVRYVALEHARPWLIHAYRNIKGRGLHKEEELAEDTNPMKAGDTEKEVNSTKPNSEDRIELERNKAIKSGDSSNTESRKRKHDDLNKTDSPVKSDVEVVISAEQSAKKETENSEECETKRQRLESSIQENEPLDLSITQKQNDVKITSDDADDKHDKANDNTDDKTQEKDSSETTAPITVTKDAGKSRERSEEMRSRSARKRKKVDEESETSTEKAPAATSTYDKVRLIIQPWRKPEGGINKPILKMMLESVMLFLMMKPCATETILINRYAPYLQPMVLKTIIKEASGEKEKILIISNFFFTFTVFSELCKILEEIGCIKTLHLRQPKCTLFSKPALPEINFDGTEDQVAMFVPTEECLFRLGQFGREFYPHASWPQSTV